MKLVIQRVNKASVSVDGQLISEIGKGLLVLVGIGNVDENTDAVYLSKKLLTLRLFDNDDTGRSWDKNVKDKNYDILLVSQFTLFAKLKGNKPDFHEAMGASTSQAFYNNFVEMVRAGYQVEKVKDGVFGAKMMVNLENDGPVTIQLDSKLKQ